MEQGSFGKIEPITTEAFDRVGRLEGGALFGARAVAMEPLWQRGAQ